MAHPGRVYRHIFGHTFSGIHDAGADVAPATTATGTQTYQMVMRNILQYSRFIRLASCSSNQETISHSGQIDYLEQRIDELEEKTLPKRPHFDLGADLENVISFLNDELNY